MKHFKETFGCYFFGLILSPRRNERNGKGDDVKAARAQPELMCFVTLLYHWGTPAKINLHLWGCYFMQLTQLEASQSLHLVHMIPLLLFFIVLTHSNLIVHIPQQTLNIPLRLQFLDLPLFYLYLFQHLRCSQALS